MNQKKAQSKKKRKGGKTKAAVTVDRTRDLFITSEMHYHCAITAIVDNARFFVLSSVHHVVLLAQEGLRARAFRWPPVGGWRRFAAVLHYEDFLKKKQGLLFFVSAAAASTGCPTHVLPVAPC